MRGVFAGSVVVVSLVSSGAAAGERCLEYGGAQSVGELGDKKLDEASGMVASARAEVLWAHNDSGADARLHALGLTGERLARFDVTGAGAVDWEDIALGPCVTAGTRDCLFIADTGNNGGERNDQTIYRVAEPDVEGAEETEAVEAMRVVISDGADVEALFVDERGGLWLVAKRDDDAVLYNVGAFRAGEDVAAVAVGTRGDITFVTGADATADGTRIVLRSSEVAWELYRGPGVSVEDAFSGATLEVALASEKQGEAITYAHDGSGFYTTSEGEGATLSWYPCLRFEAPVDVDPEPEATEVTPAEATEDAPAEATVETSLEATESTQADVETMGPKRSEGCAGAGGSVWLGLAGVLGLRRKP